MKSVVSYPNRGHWGKSGYRGNCSGYVLIDLIQQFFKNQLPKQFVEVFSGGGTGADVAKHLGISNSIHLDLSNGWNALTDDMPTGSDFVFSHPPYWDIIKYETQRGQFHPSDLSNQMTYEEFIKNLDQVNSKIYASLTNGGRHAMLIGDIRKKGKYYSMQKDITWFGELEAFITKVQHNTFSSRVQYTGSDFIPIVHEHILVFKKNHCWSLNIKMTSTTITNLKKFNNITWRDLIQMALESLGGAASLKDLYQIIEGTKKAAKNNHWKEKIRQTLQLHDNFKPISRGKWRLNIG
ncbi:hypothetical protein MOB49_21460 [Bacillus haynesii]|nr:MULTISPECIES: hypothetical protein [Bacillus]MCY7969603.1 hypothetical protein [Bacillus haynesii]MCY8102771.1 hypothetical protein [Bacillus haynesii]MCY8152143.1 hypothetical protein [Bacillus paralicheniformis]MEC1343796.1 hypothetical protein [Bacillus haynesii]